MDILDQTSCTSGKFRTDWIISQHEAEDQSRRQTEAA